MTTTATTTNPTEGEIMTAPHFVELSGHLVAVDAITTIDTDNSGSAVHIKGGPVLSVDEKPAEVMEKINLASTPW